MRMLTVFFLLLTCTVITQAQSAKIVADKIIAVVGDRIILQSELEDYNPDPERMNIMMPGNTECASIERALMFKIFSSEAEKDSLGITDEHVEEWLNRFKKQIADHPEAKQFNITNKMRKLVKEGMQAEALQGRIIDKVTITPSEVKAFYSSMPADSLLVMNFRNDYERVAGLALKEKQQKAMDEWLNIKIGKYYIEVDTDAIAKCSEIKKYVSPDIPK